MYRKLVPLFTRLMIVVTVSVFCGPSAATAGIMMPVESEASAGPEAAAAISASTGAEAADQILARAGAETSASDLDIFITQSLQSLFTPGQWKAPYIQIDGRQIAMDAQPVMKDGTTWVSYAALLKALNLGSLEGIDPTPVDGCTMVSLQELCDLLGYSLTFDAATERVLISTGAGNPSDSQNDASYTIDWQDGSYVGNLQSGIPHGQGTLTWADGSVYTGDFDNGEMTGQGTLTCPEGFTYTGAFVNGLFSGYGVWKDTAGNGYEGQWLDGRQNGFGTMIYASGAKWQGTFQDGYRFDGKFI